ncbi:MAG: sulfur carrier protein ThiS [Planctomycetota bacterium]|jgi:thiamine biosynthesis protein ThiS
MKLTLNGEPYELPAPGTPDATREPTVADLIQALGLTGQPAAVEVNRDLVPKRRHDQTALHEGDTVEVVTLVGGG